VRWCHLIVTDETTSTFLKGGDTGAIVALIDAGASVVRVSGTEVGDRVTLPAIGSRGQCIYDYTKCYQIGKMHGAFGKSSKFGVVVG
jgi:threonine dehydrogenase-like Zn-dependent dehydrogenase